MCLRNILCPLMKSRLVDFFVLQFPGMTEKSTFRKLLCLFRNLLTITYFSSCPVQDGKNYLLARHLWMQVLRMKNYFSRWTACKYKYCRRWHLVLSHGPLPVDIEQLWSEISIVNRQSNIKICRVSSAAHWFCMYIHAEMPFNLVIEPWNGSCWKII